MLCSGETGKVVHMTFPLDLNMNRRFFVIVNLSQTDRYILKAKRSSTSEGSPGGRVTCIDTAPLWMSLQVWEKKEAPSALFIVKWALISIIQRWCLLLCDCHFSPWSQEMEELHRGLGKGHKRTITKNYSSNEGRTNTRVNSCLHWGTNVSPLLGEMNILLTHPLSELRPLFAG